MLTAWPAKFLVVPMMLNGTLITLAVLLVATPFDEKDADRKCEEIAEEYGGIQPETKAVGKQEFDCNFKIWR